MIHTIQEGLSYYKRGELNNVLKYQVLSELHEFIYFKPDYR